MPPTAKSSLTSLPTTHRRPTVASGCNPPAQRLRFDDTTKCILCACCTTSSPSFWASSEYIGPASIVQAHRFVFNSRNDGAAEHLQAAGDTMGVWRCHTAFNCTLACPRGINITQAIGEVKRVLATGRIEFNPRAWSEVRALFREERDVAAFELGRGATHGQPFAR